MKGTVSTTIEFELRKMLKEKGISLTRALDFGAKFLLAEARVLKEYPDCNLGRELLRLHERLEDIRTVRNEFKTAKEVEEEGQSEEEYNKQTEEDLKNVFG